MLETVFAKRPAVDPSSIDSRSSDMLRHLEYLRYRHPRAFGLLDQNLLRNTDELSQRVAALMEIRGHSDFDDAERGKAYRAKQLAVPRSREYGDRRIFAEIARRLGNLSFTQVGLDVIGGNGATARSAAAMLPFMDAPYIIAGDPCLDMVNDAFARQLPAVWQSAELTMFADATLDFVIGSRGFHHVGVDARADAFAEGWRILKPGGVFLVVDFEEASPTARWYSEGLHAYTNTGHCFSHFRRSDFMTLLTDAGFADATVFDLYDPFRFWSDTAEGARNILLEHLVSMFGMVKLRREPDESDRDYWARIDRTLAPWCTFTAQETAFDAEALPRLSVFQEADGRWRAEFPRVALCAIGIKRQP